MTEHTATTTARPPRFASLHVLEGTLSAVAAPSVPPNDPNLTFCFCSSSATQALDDIDRAA